MERWKKSALAAAVVLALVGELGTIYFYRDAQAQRAEVEQLARELEETVDKQETQQAAVMAFKRADECYTYLSAFLSDFVTYEYSAEELRAVRSDLYEITSGVALVLAEEDDLGVHGKMPPRGRQMLEDVSAITREASRIVDEVGAVGFDQESVSRVYALQARAASGVKDARNWFWKFV